MLTETLLEDDRWGTLALPALAQKAAHAVLTHLGLDPAAHEIVVLGADDARIAALNADFRAKAQPTNVLSWPEEDLAADQPGDVPHPPQECELGNIALAYETCAREAGDAGRSPEDHVTHLVVHGVLHLLGYDHITEEDAGLMEGIEVQVLAGLGIADPYD